MSLREEQKNLTRNRVLDAAVAVFTEKSVANATMDEIAKAAGVTRVTVYAHFPGKDDIVFALAGRVYDAMAEVHAELGALPRWTRTSIRTWLDSAAERWRAMAPKLWVVRAMGAPRDLSGSRDRYREMHEKYVDFLTADAGRWRDVPPEEARQRALMAVLQTESVLSAWIVARLPMSTENPLDLLADTLCHVLGPAVERERRT